MRKDGVTMTHADGIHDLYEVLGVARDAPREEIALAWRRRARQAHPDAHHGAAGSPERFRVLAEAWAVLGDAGRRAAYDRGLDSGRPSGRVRVTVRHPVPFTAPRTTGAAG